MQTLSKQEVPKYPKNRKQGNRVYTKGIENHAYKKERYSVDPITGCWNWNLKIENSGYPRVSINSGRKQIQAHVWTWEQKNGCKVPEGKILDHTCKNPKCVNPDHLEPVTQLENIARSDIFKLTKEQVIEIRKLLSEGHTQTSLAKIYGVSTSNISKIWLRKSRTIL